MENERSVAMIPYELVNAISCKLPGDIVVDILSKQSIKTLLRFKCVSRTWRDLICDRSFALVQYNLRPPADNLLVMSHPLERAHQIKLIRQELTKIVKESLKVSSLEHDVHYWIVGCCNGLLCLASSYKYFLLNPAIDDFMAFPKPPHFHREFKNCEFTSVGYGFDPRSNDYKVVQIEYFRLPDKRILSHTQVYNLNTNSWREIDATIENIVLQGCSLAFLNGFLHWTVLLDEDDQYSIATFDISREIFGSLELLEIPPEVVKGFHCDLRTLNGYLAAILYQQKGQFCSKLFDVWGMKDYGDKDSWVHVYTIDSDQGFSSLLAFRNYGDVLFFSSDCCIYRFDPLKMERHEPAIVVDSSGRVDAASGYKESMVKATRKDFVRSNGRRGMTKYMKIFMVILLVLVLLFLCIYAIWFVIMNFEETVMLFNKEEFLVAKVNPDGSIGEVIKRGPSHNRRKEEL